MAEESKLVDPQTDKEAAEEVVQEAGVNDNDSQHGASDGEHDPEAEVTSADAGASTQKKKKKRSKKNKIKSALGLKKDDADIKEGEAGSSAGSSKAAQKMLSGPALDQFLESNPALANEVGHAPKEKIEEMIREGRLAELLTGLVRVPIGRSNAAIKQD